MASGEALPFTIIYTHPGNGFIPISTNDLCSRSVINHQKKHAFKSNLKSNPCYCFANTYVLKTKQDKATTKNNPHEPGLLETGNFTLKSTCNITMFYSVCQEVKQWKTLIIKRM